MAGTAKQRKDPTVEAVPDAEPEVTSEADAPPHAAGTCPVAWCPVCLAVTAVQPVRPEVVEHLLKAGTEFFLALRSVIDTRADQVAGGTDDGPSDGELRKIDIG
jgi:hypothetical protein